MENEIYSVIPITVAQKQIKYFGVNSIQHVLDMDPESASHDTPHQGPHTSAPVSRACCLPPLFHTQPSLPLRSFRLQCRRSSSPIPSPVSCSGRVSAPHLSHTSTKLTHQEISGSMCLRLNCSLTGCFTNVTEQKAARFVPI